MVSFRFATRSGEPACWKIDERSAFPSLRSGPGSRGGPMGPPLHEPWDRIGGLRCFLFLPGVLFLLAGFCFAQGDRSGRAIPVDSRIAGIIVSRIDGHPLARARVSLQSTKDRQNVQSVITEDDGKFAFSGLAPGKYALEGAKRGYIEAGYDQHEGYSTAIVTGAGLDTEHLILKLAPDGVIAGRVLDESGEPIRQAQVSLYVDTHQEGIEQISGYRSVQTNDLGMYEMAQLRPGTYFLAVSAKPWYAMHLRAQGESSGAASDGGAERSLDVAYPFTYYADVTDADSATPILIRGGEHVQADVHLTPVPALTLVFRVPENGNHGFIPPRLEQRAFDAPVPLQSDGYQMVKPGEVEISGVPAGKYDMRLQGSILSGIDIERDGQVIDSSKADASSTVKVSVHPAEGTSLPRQFVVALRAGSRSFAGARMVDENGNMELPGISAGSYELVTFGAGNQYSIEHMAVDGAEVTGHTITIPAGTAVSVEMSVVAGTGSVEGVAKRAGKGFAGAMVVLVPEHAEGSRDLFRRDQSDLDGSFALRNVIPGKYTVVAIENGWDIDWSRPEVIAVYAKNGRKVEVRPRAGGAVHVPDAVEVVSR